MSGLGDLLELLYLAPERAPTMRVVHVHTTYPAAIAEGRRLGAALPVPFGMLKDIPDGVVSSPREVWSEVVLDGPRWRTQRLDHRDSATADPAVAAGFNGDIAWRTGRPGLPPPTASPLQRLLDPTWLLSRHTLTPGTTTTALGRRAIIVTAAPRTSARLDGVALPAPLDTTVLVDAEYGFLLTMSQTRHGQPVTDERLDSLRLDDDTARQLASYDPPPHAARSDDATDSWAKLPTWQQRLFTAGPLAVGAWHVLRGRPFTTRARPPTD